MKGIILYENFEMCVWRFVTEYFQVLLIELKFFSSFVAFKYYLSRVYEIIFV